MLQNLSRPNQKPKIIVILGPTASGKSALAVKIALRLNSGQALRLSSGQAFRLSSGQTQKLFGIKGAEIISADSRQIYRGLDIGTAKPTKAELKKIKHYLIDIKNPDEEYTVAHYKKDATFTIEKVLKKNKLPILVGGTGLYVKAVIDNLEIPEVKPNPRLRKKLEEELKIKGLNYLYEKLIKLDPEAAYIIDRNNPRRVIRALEITIITNKPFSQQRKIGKKLFNALKIGINSAKENLKKKIEKRTDEMIKSGLLKETRQLIKKYDPELPVFDAIGYREIINYIQKRISLPEAINLIKKNTWHYAKRQITWFKKDKEIYWIKNYKEAEKLVKDFLK